MKQIIAFFSLIIFIAAAGACAGPTRHHKAHMPDPASFKAHFPEMDTNGDDQVNWTEFKNHFDQASPEVFNELDLNKDGGVDHDEWHQFKAAHGLKDH